MFKYIVVGMIVLSYLLLVYLSEVDLVMSKRWILNQHLTEKPIQQADGLTESF